MTSLEDVIGAIESSTLLEVNQEKTQIRRKVPLHVKEVSADTDKRTIYAVCISNGLNLKTNVWSHLIIFHLKENIPRSSDHDLLRQIFGKCGEIV